MTGWTPPGWLIETTRTVDPDGQSIVAHCLADGCGYTIYTWSRTTIDPETFGLGHQNQHRPGRALDIEVDGEPSAHCSVCPDGIGDIRTGDDSGIECTECGTWWEHDGTGGPLREDNAR